MFRRTAPDPFVIAVLLTVATAVLGLAFGYRGEPGGASVGVWERAGRLVDAWGGAGGVWSLLAFSMQMCVVLVTGHALAASPPVARAIRAVADLPRTGSQAAALVAAAACAAGVVNWGLGLIIGALLARDVWESARRRGVRVGLPVLAGAGYSGLMVWHGGLSGSAPLSMTTVENALKVFPAGVVERIGARGDGTLIPLSETLLSPLNLVVTGGLLVIVPAVYWMLGASGEGGDAGGTTGGGAVAARRGAGCGERVAEADAGGVVPEWLERSPLVVWGLAAALLVAVGREAARREGLDAIGLNEVCAAMLALGLIFHGSARSYVAAVDEAARGCGGIILQFPLYGGIMGMMRDAGLVERLAEWIASISGERTMPLLTFASACVVNLFVPSGGGQWAVQGPIALEAGLGAGVSPGTMVMCVAYGDQLTNMVQPFWALPLLAITGARAREIVGYTAVAMLAGGAWIALWVLVL